MKTQHLSVYVQLGPIVQMENPAVTTVVLVTGVWRVLMSVQNVWLVKTALTGL